MELFQCGLCQIKFSAVSDFFQHFQRHRDLLCSSHNDVSSNKTKSPNSLSLNDQSFLTQSSNCKENDQTKLTDIHELLLMCNKSANNVNEIATNKDDESCLDITQASEYQCAACKEKYPTICAFTAHLDKKSFYFCEETMTCIPKTLNCSLSGDSDFFISVELHNRNECEQVSDAVAMSMLDHINDHDPLTENQESMTVVKIERPDIESSSHASVRNCVTDKRGHETEEPMYRHGMAKKSKIRCEDLVHSKSSNNQDKHKSSAGTCVAPTNQEPDVALDMSESREEHSNTTPDTDSYLGTTDTELNPQLPPRKVIHKKRGRPPKSSIKKADSPTYSTGISAKTSADVTQAQTLQQEDKDSCSDEVNQYDINKMETFEERFTDNADYEIHPKRNCGRPKKPDSELKYPRKGTFGARVRGRPRKPDHELKYRRKKKIKSSSAVKRSIQPIKPKDDRRERLTCDNCGKMVFRYCLKNHVKVCTMDRPFVCEECGATFATKGGLSSHNKCIHRKALPYQCEVCGASFFVPSKLAKHMRNHSGEKKFACSCCDKTFKHQEYLTKHEKLHTGVKDQVCATCGKMFYSNWNLKQHELTHREVGAFECNRCHRTFTVRRSLKKHQEQANCRIQGSYMPDNMIIHTDYTDVPPVNMMV